MEHLFNCHEWCDSFWCWAKELSEESFTEIMSKKDAAGYNDGLDVGDDVGASVGNSVDNLPDDLSNILPDDLPKEDS